MNVRPRFWPVPIPDPKLCQCPACEEPLVFIGNDEPYSGHFYRCPKCLSEYDKCTSCERPALTADGKCIGHDPNPDKDAKLFAREFEKMAYGRGGSVNADCSRWVFPDGLYMLEERFESINFSEAIFLKSVYAVEMKASRIDFSRARFAENVTFHECSLRGADFSGAHFEKDVVFEHGTTIGTGAFEHATFAGRAEFDRVTFLGDVKFVATRFASRVSFGYCDFEPTEDAGSSVADFTFAEFAEPDAVRFFRINRKTKQPFRMRVRGCDVRECHFADVNWHRESGRLMLEDEFDLEDGRLEKVRHQQEFDKWKDDYEFNPEWLPEPFEPTGHDLVATSYRQLVANFERDRAFDLAEECWISVMELKRIGPTNSWATKTAIEVYRRASVYGTSYVRALVVLILAVLVAFPTLLSLPFARMARSTEPDRDIAFSRRIALPRHRYETVLSQSIRQGRHNVAAITHIIGRAMLLSVETATFQRNPRYVATSAYARSIVALESVVIVGQTALFLLALRRRFRSST